MLLTKAKVLCLNYGSQEELTVVSFVLKEKMEKNRQNSVICLHL